MSADNIQSLAQLEQTDAFIGRHIGPNTTEQLSMLAELGLESLDQLIEQTVPGSIQLKQPINLDECRTEEDVLAELKQIASRNIINRSMIGMGYTDTIVPNVILRNVLENPGWYTAYTPYQPEVAQGRLEALLNYQQMVLDLTGLDLANASLLDEATAAAEAMTLCKRMSKARKANVFLVDENLHPQNISVIQTRAEPLGYEVIVGNLDTLIDQHEPFGVIAQYPGTYGHVKDLSELIEKAHDKKALFCAAADIMSLVMLKSPGELGADVVFGSAQRFGVPMGFGGPHAAFFATRDEYKRSVPGRIIGVSVDTRGNQALRMAMQTREQHIRREKATSNICTAQVLLANMSSFFAVYHDFTLKSLTESSDERIAGIAAKSLKEVTYHLRRASEWVKRLGDGTEESHRRINALSDIAREDTTRYARQELETAKTRLKAAREALTAFRMRSRMVDPAADIQGKMGLLNSLQAQLAQALIAFGRGEWFGVGLGNGIQKQFYLPEAHTDFLMAVVGEEFGLLGTLMVIGLFGMLGWRAFAIGAAAQLRDARFGAYAAYGVGLWLGLQAFINLGVNVGLLPTKGLTLPFMSYGGNSLLVGCAAVGRLLRIQRENRDAEHTDGGGKWQRA